MWKLSATTLRDKLLFLLFVLLLASGQLGCDQAQEEVLNDSGQVTQQLTGSEEEQEKESDGDDDDDPEGEDDD